MSPRGGYREGSGRKPQPIAAHKVRRVIFISRHASAALDAMRAPEETLGQLLERIIERYQLTPPWVADVAGVAVSDEIEAELAATREARRVK